MKMKCIYCGNENPTLMFKADIFDRALFDINNHSEKLKQKMGIYHCDKCDYGFAEPVLSSSDIEELYNTYEYTSPFNGLSVSTWFDRNIKIISQFLEKDKYIVEIGASEGYFLHLLNEAGYKNNLGIEPSKHVLKGIERGLNMKQIFFTEESVNEYNLFPNKVDAFVLLHTFEHFEDPFIIFETMVKYLKDDGLIFMETPNFSSFNVGHISYFSWPFYEKMAHKYNMKIIYVVDDDENISVVFAKEGSKYNEIKCPYDFNKVKDKVMLRLSQGDTFYLNGLNEIKKLLPVSKNAILWGTKITAANIVTDIENIEQYGCHIIPVDSYESRRGFIMQNISTPTAVPKDIANQSFDLVIVTTEFIEEVKKTMKEHNIAYNHIIHMVQV